MYENNNFSEIEKIFQTRDAKKGGVDTEEIKLQNPDGSSFGRAQVYGSSLNKKRSRKRLRSMRPEIIAVALAVALGIGLQTASEHYSDLYAQEQRTKVYELTDAPESIVVEYVRAVDAYFMGTRWESIAQGFTEDIYVSIRNGESPDPGDLRKLENWAMDFGFGIMRVDGVPIGIISPQREKTNDNVLG